MFSDIHLLLTHHYRVHRCGLPHIAFRKDYLARLRGLVTQAVDQSRRDTIFLVVSSLVSSHYARSVEQDSDTSRLSQMRPVRILQELVGDLQVVTAQEASDMQGALVYDCRHPLLPVSLRLESLGEGWADRSPAEGPTAAVARKALPRKNLPG